MQDAADSDVASGDSPKTPGLRSSPQPLSFLDATIAAGGDCSKALTEKVKRLEAALQMERNSREACERAMATLRRDLENMTHMKNDLDCRLETAQAEAGMIKSRAEDLDRTLDETTKAGDAACVTNAELRGELATLHASYLAMVQASCRLAKEAEESKHEVDKCKKEADEHKNAASLLAKVTKDARKEASDARQELQAAMDISNMQLKECEDEVVRGRRALAEVVTELASSQSRVRELERRLEEAAKEGAALKTSKDDLHATVASFQNSDKSRIAVMEATIAAGVDSSKALLETPALPSSLLPFSEATIAAGGDSSKALTGQVKRLEDGRERDSESEEEAEEEAEEEEARSKRREYVASRVVRLWQHRAMGRALGGWYEEHEKLRAALRLRSPHTLIAAAAARSRERAAELRLLRSRSSGEGGGGHALRGSSSAGDVLLAARRNSLQPLENRYTVSPQERAYYPIEARRYSAPDVLVLAAFAREHNASALPPDPAASVARGTSAAPAAPAAEVWPVTLDVARLSAMAQEGQGLSRQTERERESEREGEEEEHEEQKGPAREGGRVREKEEVEEEEKEGWGGAVSARDWSGGGMSRSGGAGKEGCARCESETRRLVGEASAGLVRELREAERELLSIRQGWAGREEVGVKMQRARDSQKDVEEVGEQVVKVALLLVP
jgi:hypothetical protein